MLWTAIVTTVIRSRQESKPEVRTYHLEHLDYLTACQNGYQLVEMAPVEGWVDHVSMQIVPEINSQGE